MTTQRKQVLLVGPNFHKDQILPGWLGKLGFQCHYADSIQTAVHLLAATKIDLVLCPTSLPDGSGYSLVMPLEGLPITAFLGLCVEEGCIWMAAIEQGRNCLGKAAFFPGEFAGVLEQMALPQPRPSMGSSPLSQTGAV
jgi:hypothetical protein